MNKGLTQYLFDNFSFWSAQVRQDGFMCGDGWFDLIRVLCEDITRLKPSSNFSVVQVKEKGGMLRIYADNVPLSIARLVKDAEGASTQRCEYCGANGSTQLKGVILKTICRLHEALYRKDRAWPSV
jgi:hypothetical protein